MGIGSSSDVDFEKYDFDSVTTTNKFLAKGACGEVYGPFTWNSRKCALKRIWINVGRTGDDLKMKVKAKTNIWTSIKHKNLLEIYNIVLQPKALYIVMEHANGGSLRCLLDTFIPDVHCQIDVSNWGRQIAEGMQYLHEKDVVHRDLKSGNILLMDKFDPFDAHKDVTLKITDFDEAKEHDHTTTVSFKGTCAYMAPEILITEKFSKASDVWSYGVVIWELLTSDVPHKDQGIGLLMEEAQSGKLTLSTPESFPTLYTELLQDLVGTIRTKATEKGKKSIFGLTILDKELFVVSQESSELEAYDLIQFSFSYEWNLKELICPVDIASCNRNKCLYISDYKDPYTSSEILRVDPIEKVIKKWSTKGESGRLSVTYESNVILIDQHENKINEYSSDGLFLRGINLSSEEGFHYPNHAIKLINGHFVVSHGLDDTDLPRVCIVDADGKLLTKFDGKLRSTIGQTISPVHMSVDGNGFVMVADRVNKRVLLLDSELKFKTEILSEVHGLRCPTRILLDESNDRLFVADNESNNQRIWIFKLQSRTRNFCSRL